MRKIMPNLWFDTRAEEAARFYIALFPNSKITSMSHYTPEIAKATKMPEGLVLTVAFELDGNPFLGLNGAYEGR